MTIIWMDGFDTYATVADMQKKGYSTITSSLVTGRFTGSQAFRNIGGLAPQAFGVASGNTFSVGFALRIDDLSGCSTGKAILSFLGAAGATAVCKLGVDINGALHFGRGDFTTNDICHSANSTLQISTWNYVEIELTRSATVGIVNVYFNGALVATASAANTGAIAIDTLSFFTEFYNANKDVDDLYVTNVATKLGECRIDTLRPSADTAQKDWTPSSGITDFSRVNEAHFDGDTTYISAAVATNYDLFDVDNLTTSPASVFAVQTVMAARKDDATTRQVRTKMKNGATTTNGTTQNMGTSFGFTTDLYQTNPNTAAAWTAADVNAMQLGVEVVT